MREVNKAEFLDYYERGLLRDILVLVDKVLARKEAQNEQDVHEVIWVAYP